MGISPLLSEQSRTLDIWIDSDTPTASSTSDLGDLSTSVDVSPQEPYATPVSMDFERSSCPDSRKHSRPPPVSKSSFPQVIPPRNPVRNRTLVLYFDGTGDEYDQDNSNIVQFVHLLNKDNFDNQMVYYQAGIGTTSKHFITPIGVALSKAADMALAHGLQNHVTDGYEFLMQSYREGDKVGLLPRSNHQQVPFAYHMYQRDDEEGCEMSNGFKQAFSIDVEIYFMGLFDTVNSVGLIPRELPFAKSNYVLRHFRHAVSLDERRAKFKDNLWGRTSEQDAALAASPRADYIPNRQRRQFRKMTLQWSRGERVSYRKQGKPSPQGYEEVYITLDSYGVGVSQPSNKTLKRWITQTAAIASEEHKIQLRMLSEASEYSEPKLMFKVEVWFAGAHTDVGGGSVKNGERYSLARIPLRWMVRQCFKCDTGIMFHSNLLEDVGLSPDTLWPKVLPRPPPITSLDQILDIRYWIDPSPEPDHFSYTHHSSSLNGNSSRFANSYQSKGVPLPGQPDRHHIQLSESVEPYEPYIPIRWRIGHELRDFGPDAWEPREPFISEEVEDFKDALSPIYDQLALNWWWWMLEFIPIKQVWRNKEKGWRKILGINLGGPRVIKNQKSNGINVHRTVKIRMESKSGLDGRAFSYAPRAALKRPWIQWVEGSEYNIP